MANRPKGYGLSGEIASKIDSKYSDEDEKEICQWINAITGQTCPQSGAKGVQEWLKDGTVLCMLINAIAENPIKKYNTSKMAFKQMENISMFLTACENYGVPKTDLFQTVSLYEGTNMPQVLATLRALSSVSIKKGYGGPVCGVKIATANKREQDEQKLREGRNAIGLQMGTNQVDSQKGMTPYGLGRQLTPQNK